MAWPDPPNTEFLKEFWNKPPSGASSYAGPQKHAFCMTDHGPRSPFGADLSEVDDKCTPRSRRLKSIKVKRGP